MQTANNHRTKPAFDTGAQVQQRSSFKKPKAMRRRI